MGRNRDEVRQAQCMRVKMSTHTYANEREARLRSGLICASVHGVLACALPDPHQARASCACVRSLHTYEEIESTTRMLWDLLKRKLPRALALTRPVSRGTAAAWKQLYLFNYPPLRRRHISAATPTAHELMMHISGCY